MNPGTSRYSHFKSSLTFPIASTTVSPTCLILRSSSSGIVANLDRSMIRCPFSSSFRISAFLNALFTLDLRCFSDCVSISLDNTKLRYVLLKLQNQGFVGVSASTHGAVLLLSLQDTKANRIGRMCQFRIFSKAKIIVLSK